MTQYAKIEKVRRLRLNKSVKTSKKKEILDFQDLEPLRIRVKTPRQSSEEENLDEFVLNSLEKRKLKYLQTIFLIDRKNTIKANRKFKKMRLFFKKQKNPKYKEKMSSINLSNHRWHLFTVPVINPATSDTKHITSNTHMKILKYKRFKQFNIMNMLCKKVRKLDLIIQKPFLLQILY